MDEKVTKELPIPVATNRPSRQLHRLRNALALTAACGLVYLGTSSWGARHHHAAHVDSSFETSKGIRYRHKGFGLDPKKAENIFLSVPNAESAIAVSRAWTAKPHYAGTDNDYTSAIEQLEVFQKHLGIKPPKSIPVFDAGSTQSRQSILSISNLTEPTAWVDTYYSLLNTPGERKLEIINEDGTPFWSANVDETPAEGDPAGQWHNVVGAWHGLSRGGDVQGRIVHVNYGTKKDFDDLIAAGHNLTGTIALARYGRVFRGLKILRQVKAAQEAGAVGCLIYSDPRDNGPVTVENGYKAWPEGPALNPDSVQRGSVVFLSTYPGDPTTPGYPSYPGVNRTEGVNIPAIPSLPISWANAQVLLKEIGGDSVFSARKIRLLNGVKDAVTPIWNTMAVIPGHVRNEVVLLGNHRDAWVLGAADPTSGTVAVHEIAKGLGELLKQGWKPLRTIILASWDAEEYGLIGSTEWGEDFADWIQENVTTQYALELGGYLDRVTELSAHMNVAPDFTGLRHAISKVQKASIALDHRKAHAERRLRRALEKIGHRQQHACARRKFAKTRTWVKKVFGVYEDVEKRVEEKVKGVEWPKKWPEGVRIPPRIGRLPAWAEEQQEKTKERGHQRHGHDKHHRHDKHHGHHKHGGFRKLIRAVKEVQAVNKKLSTFEQGFLSDEGIPDREWYRHLGVAPGKWLGYGATTLPALTEAITIEKNSTLAAYEVERLTSLLEKLAEKLE
ncbi:hypothetical protein FRC07_011555 [Ceratobasidium sp. 392]|nr:hypothetical protein FRC07_011555 [Ceratobasidium sp. 392]